MRVMATSDNDTVEKGSYFWKRNNNKIKTYVNAQ